MLLQTRVAFSLRCPQCGKSDCDTVSLFDLSGGRSLKVTCKCGNHKLTLASRKGTYWLQIPCYLCEGMHFLYYSSRDLFAPGLHRIPCSETDLQLGLMGDPAEVTLAAQAGRGELDHLLEEAAFDDFFHNPGIMYGVISHLHALSERGDLGCTCGVPSIGVDIFPERLDLACSACGKIRSLTAGTEDDLLRVQNLGRIMIGEEPLERTKSAPPRSQ